MPLFEHSGKRLQANLIKVCQRKNGQFVMTIPRKLAEQEGLKHGSVVIVESQIYGGLSIKKTETVIDGELI